MTRTKEDYVNNLNIVYEDNHLLVVEKFINVLSQKDETADIDMNEIIKLYLKNKYNKPGNVYLGLIHRLDRRVGGVMVFAKTSKAANRLSEDIRNHQFHKEYLVRVKGLISNDGSINVSILKDEKTRMAIVSPNGKPSLLNYQVIKKDSFSTILSVELITGRYNQIRVSFAHIGHPIINDYKYDSSIFPTKDELALYCHCIRLNHPVTKEVLEFKLFPKSKVWI